MASPVRSGLGNPTNTSVVGPLAKFIRTKLDRGWRRFATGLSFVIFGIGGLSLGLLVLPLMSLIVRDSAKRTAYARRAVAFLFRRFIGIMHGLGLLTYEMRGFEKLQRKGLLILSNHPSLIDTVFLLGFIRNSTCVAGDRLYRNPVMEKPLSAAGFIRNDAGIDVMTDCVAALDSGLNVLIFPEGTRTPLNSGTPRLKRGGANIAIRADRNITPVIIQCSPRTLMKGQRWWQIPDRKPHWTLTVGEDIAVQEFSQDDESPALAVRRLTAYLEQYFTTSGPPHAIS